LFRDEKRGLKEAQRPITQPPRIPYVAEAFPIQYTSRPLMANNEMFGRFPQEQVK